MLKRSPLIAQVKEIASAEARERSFCSHIPLVIPHDGIVAIASWDEFSQRRFRCFHRCESGMKNVTREDNSISGNRIKTFDQVFQLVCSEIPAKVEIGNLNDCDGIAHSAQCWKRQFVLIEHRILIAFSQTITCGAKRGRQAGQTGKSEKRASGNVAHMVPRPFFRIMKFLIAIAGSGRLPGLWRKILAFPGRAEIGINTPLSAPGAPHTESQGCSVVTTGRFDMGKTQLSASRLAKRRHIKTTAATELK